MSEYEKYTFDAIVETHKKMLIESDILNSENADKKIELYIEKVEVALQLRGGRLLFFPSKQDQSLKLQDNSITEFWDQKSLEGVYFAPVLSDDSYSGSLEFCLPSYLPEILPENIEFSEAYSFDHHIKNLKYRFFEFSGLGDFEINTLQWITSDLKKIESEPSRCALLIAEQVKRLERDFFHNFINVEEENEAVAADHFLTEIIREAIILGRGYEYANLEKQGVIDRLRMQAAWSSNHQGTSFHELPKHEKLMIKLYAENKNLTPTLLIKELVKRGYLTNLKGLAPSNKNCILVNKQGEKFSAPKLISRWKKPLKSNYENGDYPEAEPRTNFSQ